ncbi:MAG: DUF2283 domain-containing protein [Gammaproteobacteria bacterium]|nr:DUF2283 domain-containing protein [Gammaproteobacteria bacterium]
MKLTYDPQHNIAYIRFHERSGTVTTIELSDDIHLDVAADGTLYGIELMNANQQLADDGGRLIIEAGGRRQEIALSA